MATVTAGTAVRPFTLFVNKATIESECHAELTWSAAHAGVAAGVMEAVAEGIAAAAELLVIAVVWVNPQAADERLVFENNKAATLGALRADQAGRPFVGEALSAWHQPSKAYFSAS